MSGFPTPAVESFARKENLNDLQRRFDETITRLFPGGKIVGLPCVAMIPVPLSFVAPEALSHFTDASIAPWPEASRVKGRPVLTWPQPENLAWMTVTPIPTARWRARKLRRQEARWHAELRRMWLDGEGRLSAGRKHGDDGHSWDVAKNPLQDPVLFKPFRLAAGESLRSPTYGWVSERDDGGGHITIAVADEPVVIVERTDLHCLKRPAAGELVAIGEPILTHWASHDVVVGRAVYRGGRVSRTRCLRDHLSADRHRLIVGAVCDLFERLSAGPAHVVFDTEWPWLARDGRTVVIPAPADKMAPGTLPTLLYSQPIWNRFDRASGGISWRLAPTDARYIA